MLLHKNRIASVGAALALLLLGGCSGYHKLYRNADPDPNLAPEVHFIEADDEGWFWDTDQAKNTLKAVREAANASDTVVVTFVHGWHHLAKCCDDNLEGFKEVLRRLEAQLDRDMYAVARQRIHGAGKKVGRVRIVGIYVGWRGRALPGLLDYLTFWKRKAAAERVGEGDLQEFLIRLRNFHEERQMPTDPANARLFGMVTIGHSFGGQVVLKSTAGYLEHKLAGLTTESGYLRDPTANRTDELQKAVAGFGDLVVLVNPAVESAAYQRLHSLSRMKFHESQWPLVLTISASNDQPRSRFFRWGRIAGEIFTGKPRYAKRERALERYALGFAGEQVTHTLKAVDEDQVLVRQPKTQTPEPECMMCKEHTYDWYEWKERKNARTEIDSLSADICGFPPEQRQRELERIVEKIKTYDFSKRTVFADIVLDLATPDPDQDPPPLPPLPHQAFIVAEAAPNVIDGHNGMFARPLMDFLTTYIGFAEAKRLFPLLPLAGPLDPETCNDEAKGR
jgi:hypothetical protein